MNRKNFYVFSGVFIAWLTAAPIFSGECSEAKGNSYMPMMYADRWVTLNAGDIDRKMNEPIMDPNTQEPFNFKTVDMVVGMEDKEIGQINTPAEYYTCICKGGNLYVPSNAAIIDYGNFTSVAMLLIYLSKAKPSKQSYVRDITFNKDDPLRILPVSFINWHGSDQREAIDEAFAGKKSWREIAPRARIEEATESSIDIYDTFAEDFYSTPENERYYGGRVSNIISLSVLGDLNDDGYEDIVLNAAHYYVEGSGRYYYFVVLTRKSSNEVLEDITDSVNKELF